MTRGQRVFLAVAVGAVVAFRAYQAGAREGNPQDFLQVWAAARAMLAGHDPYAAIGPGRATPFPYVLLYPLTAAVVALPVAWLPVQWAATVFVFVGVTLFAYALSANPPALLCLLAAPLWFAAEEAQWSPLLASATALPVVGLVFAAKPTIAAAIFAARPSRWPFIGGAVLLAVSLAFRPEWPLAWWHAVMLRPPALGAPERYRALITQPGGFLILAALLRWRRPEARLLVALACVPQTTALYEATPLLLVPRTSGEAGAFVALSWVAFLLVLFSGPLSYGERLPVSAQAIVWCLYLPCVLMVLRRPNEGPALFKWPNMPAALVKIRAGF